MKTVLVVLILCANLATGGAAQAALIDRGGGLIYDDDRDITWLSNASAYATSSGSGLLTTWGLASGWASNLVYFDAVRNVYWDDWRLPVSDGCYWSNCNGSEMGRLYFTELGGFGDLRDNHNSNYYLFQDIKPGPYWSSTPYGLNPNTYVHVFDFYTGAQYFRNKQNEFAHAWAVRDGDVGAAVAIPEPGTMAMLLAGLGLVGAIHARRRSPTSRFHFNTE